MQAALVSLVSAMLLSVVATAQTTRIIPASAANIDGNWASFVPFAYGVTRTQQIWDTDVIANQGVISAIAWRIDANQPRASAVFMMPSLRVRMGATSRTPQTMSSTYASNITSSMTVVFAGNFSVAVQPKSTDVVTPMGVKLLFQTPMPFARSAGDLLLDMQTAPTPLAQTYFFADAVVNGGTCVPFGVAGKPSVGSLDFDCLSGRLDLVPGGSVQFVTRAGGSPMGFVAIGGSRTGFQGLMLPYDLSGLGAPGSSLYVGVDVMMPHRFTGSISRLRMEVPANPFLVGRELNAQSFILDWTANPLGFVASRGIAVRFADPLADPPTRAVGGPATTSPSGLFSNLSIPGTGGPVVEFTGTFQ